MTQTPPQRGIVVFSGGTAANSLVDVFNDITRKRRCSLSYVIPISDNGGSSSELIRVFGGPGIGDLRSRLIRLIPPSHDHIHSLLNHRLDPDPTLALSSWQSLVSGTSPLWIPMPPPQRELIRSMLNHLNLEILKRARPPLSTFNFSSASLGNLFLTGARLFTGSFEAAIYLLSLIGGVSDNVAVVPGVNSMFSHHISAGLADGTVITGQNAISHPSAPTALPDRSSPAFEGENGHEEDRETEDAYLPGSLPTLRQPNIIFSKTEEEELPSRIERIWYINPYGQEIHPAANPKAVSVISNADAVIYSIGSLYTSIAPCLVLRGVGAAISSSPPLRYKILILNGSIDRETGPRSDPMGAVDFVAAVARAGEESQGRMGRAGKEVWRRYVTHVVFLEGEGAPKVEREELEKAGVECVRCWGRKGEWTGLRYDGMGLAGALEAILGRRDLPEKSRRNTLEG
ncbi:hypothetical protein MMC13_003496 [Lambiella insularis]|nr:hypothetical protein [Lambiella insularis]